MIIYNPPPTVSIEIAAERACRIAAFSGEGVQFEFNGVLLVATPASSAFHVISRYEKVIHAPDVILSLKQQVRDLEDEIAQLRSDAEAWRNFCQKTMTGQKL